MYTTSDDGLNQDILSADTSAFLCGGIISTMACFEAYVIDLLDEAYDTILFIYQSKHSATVLQP